MQVLKGTAYQYEDESTDPSVAKAGAYNGSQFASDQLPVDLLGQVLSVDRHRETSIYHYDLDDNGKLSCLRYLKDDQHFHRFENSYDHS